MKELIITIGLPGSGKSSYAQRLREQAFAQNKSCSIHSTDSFFIKDGVYRFVPSKLSEYHEKNFECFSKFIEKDTELVIVDNTNLIRAHRAKYVAKARQHGYRVEYVIIGSMNQDACKIYAKRNLHGVPEEAILRMASKFQPVIETELGDHDHVQVI